MPHRVWESFSDLKWLGGCSHIPDPWHASKLSDYCCVFVPQGFQRFAQQRRGRVNTASLVQYHRFSNGKPLWPHLVSLCLQWLSRTKKEPVEWASDSLAHKWRGRQPFFSTVMSLRRRHIENENSREAIKQQAISEVALDMGQQWEVSIIIIFTPLSVYFFDTYNKSPLENQYLYF